MEQIFQSDVPRLVFNDKMILVQEKPRGASMLIEIQQQNNNRNVLDIPLLQQLQTDPKQIVVINGIRLVTVGELPIVPNTGNANAPLTELLKITLMLYAEGWQKGYQIPLIALNNTFIEGSGIPYRDRSTKFDNWQYVDWNKSTLNYANGTVSVGAPYSFLLEVEYTRFNKDGKEIFGSSV